MNRVKALESATAIRLLSVTVAALLWLSVVMERPGQTKLLVPVRARHLPAGLALAAPPPEKVEVIVAGPRILLLLLPLRDAGCELDLSRAKAGGNLLTPQELSLPLPEPELKVVRVAPVSVNLAPAPVAR